MDPKYLDLEVELTGKDGNAFNIIGIVRAAIKRHLLVVYGFDRSEADARVQEFTDEATSGDYDNVLQTCMRWVRVT